MSFSQSLKRGLSIKQHESAKRIMELKKFADIMYCADEIFTTSIEYDKGEDKPTWK